MNFEKLYQPGVVRTYSGVYFDLENPRPEDVNIKDIAIGLARECRFHGGAKKWYSVAEHSVWCAARGLKDFGSKRDIAFKLLLHDAHEYIVKDIPSPIKQFLSGYRELSERVQCAIDARFQLNYSAKDRKDIAHIDSLALQHEWITRVEDSPRVAMTPEMGADIFLAQFRALCPDHLKQEVFHAT